MRAKRESTSYQMTPEQINLLRDTLGPTGKHTATFSEKVKLNGSIQIHQKIVESFLQKNEHAKQQYNDKIVIGCAVAMHRIAKGMQNDESKDRLHTKIRSAHNSIHTHILALRLIASMGKKSPMRAVSTSESEKACEYAWDAMEFFAHPAMRRQIKKVRSISLSS
jgi:hypothetical protein